MHPRSILNVLGALISILALTMLLAAVWSWVYGDPDLDGILLSSAVTLMIALPVWYFTRGPVQLSIKDGFAVVTFAWLAVATFGSLPFLLTGTIPNVTDAFFESMSGVTTTGATIIGDSRTLPHLSRGIESMPHGVLFWRSFIQWIGGMGIIVFSIAILPLLGVGGVQLFKAEVPGMMADKIKPRVRETAKTLWLVYFGISLAETALLLAGGLSLFDSMCHTFTTMATGGFSTKNASIGHFTHPFVQYTFVFFMFLAGVNFSLHWRALTGNIKGYFRDGEFRFYVGLIAVFSASIMVNNAAKAGIFHHGIFRDSLFQVVSIMTTTGYGTADYLLWGSFAQIVMLLLMFFGGCAGSTGGGMKVARVLVMIKYSVSEIKRLLHPTAVIPLRIRHRSVGEDIVRKTLGFILFYVSTFVTVSVVLTALGLDLVSAFGATAASLGNIGPGLGSVGPASNYALLPGLAKWLLSFCMLLGRLEIFTVMVVLSRSFWKR
ncbi:MAG: TrkH family potassium uptake protein [Fidelibacterota bacterium]